ncbi:hypothetical protein, partial [Legionella pneumophila]|uniref:hypothetical protein n=1 Tax=Legionella pneumophila TaxID=446 RepID=UPI000A42C954
FLSGKNMDYQSISELLQRIQATGLLRRYAPRNDGPKNRTVQSLRYCLSIQLTLFHGYWPI